MVVMIAMTTTTLSADDAHAPLTTAQAMALPQPAPDERISYGEDPLQFGELRLPEGDGPFPVAIVLHGGCWLADYDLGYISGLADALTTIGVATWSLEYRRVGDPGGGWPGTFSDVADGADFVRQLATDHPLDLEQVIVVGHSAGGHLALWLAGRPGLADSDPLRGGSPLAVTGVVALAAIPDLAAYSSTEGCGAAIPGLLGGDPADLPDRLCRTSPIAMLPLTVPQRLLIGSNDPIVPPALVERYAAAAAAAGDDADLDIVPGAGHFETVAPGSDAWPRVVRAVRSLLDSKH